MFKIKFAKIEKESLNNGPGVRVALWCQGCSLNCKGCHNPETHNFNEGSFLLRKDVDDIFKELEKSYVDGITFTGGHPLEPENIEVCTELAAQINEKFPDKTIWLYTGWIWENIKDLAIFKYVDVVVDGPYIESERDVSLPFRGSKNQRLIDVKESLKKNKTILWSLAE